jgi:hypothetical protein
MEKKVNNRRAAPRINNSWEVLLDDGEGRTRDVSAGGVYFLTNRQLVVDSWIHFVMLSPEPGSAFIWCEGRVVRVEPLEVGEIGVGIEVENFHCARLSSLSSPIAALQAGRIDKE